MTDSNNLPAKIATPSTSLLPTDSEWSRLKEICQIAVESGLIPLKDARQAVIIALKGRELNIPPMQAFSHISVIQGKPAMNAELMLSLIYRQVPGAKIDFLETTDKICRVRATRPGEQSSEWSFSFEDAAKLGLTNKDNYRKQPATMLRWRCISAMARAKFPDALMGVSYTPEELGAQVNEEGEIIDIASPSIRTPLEEAPSQEIVSSPQRSEDEVIKQAVEQKPEGELPKTGYDERLITEKQLKMLHALVKAKGWNNHQRTDFLEKMKIPFGDETRIPFSRVSEIFESIKKI